MPIDLKQPPHRRAIIIEWNMRYVANNHARQWDPDTGGDQTFGSIELSPNGWPEDPTHTGCNTAATDPMLNGIEQAMQSVPWASVYEQRDGEEAHDLWERALGSEGLQEIVDPNVI